MAQNAAASCGSKADQHATLKLDYMFYLQEESWSLAHFPYSFISVFKDHLEPHTSTSDFE